MDYKKVKKAREDWTDKTLDPVLKKFPERKEKFLTGSNKEVKRLYDPLDTENIDYLKEIGYPGDYPYTRGVQPTMYRGRLWTMRQYAGFGDAEESNRRYKYLLKNGQTGLSIAFDLPTQIGYDSDNSMSHGEVGKVGVAIDSLKDMEILFEGIPLDKVSTSMTINAPAAVLLAMYIAVAEKQGVPANKLNGTIQNDILKEYIARGTYIFPPLPSMRLITDIFEFCSKELPRWNTISISGYHIREAGSSAIQEIAFTLANGIAYVDAAVKKGLDVDNFAPRLSFFFNAHNDLFEEIAKFRAARKLWAKIMKERFGAKNPKSLMLRFHTQTAGCTLTAQQPDNNIIRVTLQALAAVLGGTQSLHTNSRDEALSLPSQKSVRIALRTQQVIGHESGVTETVDPLAGSYYIETMTREIEDEVMVYIDKIDKLGGAPKAIENGFVQREIQNSAYQYQKDIEDKKKIIVGVNQFQSEEETMKDLLKVNPKIEKQQVEKLEDTKKSRAGNEVNKKLKELKKAANTDKNLMPFIIDCVKSYATLGEICDQLRDVFGEYKDSIKI
ncbi:MAG: methylmalonyl-CoA mutase family protein [Atribacterota bacterium]|nr:methylmalonyl-CoA mutase family protein [Atribacterota bacterium]MDD3640435.1 methylmalonyl-CoA mutase family protein [Atribacterota bacterium]MDD4765662.1 methylmalonyl-CoA mutase family protein [Atribacterota bacterium]MDD5636073.1 methylmalonyl-CoA mutase family protein [Atribacterota bacterium]MDI9597796.1 methylmalonyl-CoA mutase family protein [Atribacterota bacterium]